MQKRFKNVKILKNDYSGFENCELEIKDGFAVISKCKKASCYEENFEKSVFILPSFKNYDLDLRNLNPQEAEKRILQNVSVGVTDFIVISDDLISMRFILKRLGVNWKIALPSNFDIEALENIEKDRFLLYCEPAVDEEDVLEKISDFAGKNNLNVYIKLFEDLQKTGELNSKTSTLPINYVESLGLLDRGGYLSGAICSDKEDYMLLNQYDFSVVIRPIADLRKGKGLSNVVQIANADLKVDVGSADENKFMPFQNMRTMLLGMKGMLTDENAITEKETLKLLTNDNLSFDLKDFVVIEGNFDSVESLVNEANETDILLNVCDRKIIYDREVENDN